MQHKIAPAPLLLLLVSLTVVGLVACGDDDTESGDTPQPDTTDDADAGGGDVDTDSGTPDTGGPDTGDTEGSADTDPAPPEPAWCQGTTAHLWDPINATELQFFPDGTLVREDETSPTGWRIDITDESAPWVATTPDLLLDSFRAFNELSGFGVLGGVLLRFTAPVTSVPVDDTDSITNPGWIWLDLSTEPATRVPFEARILEDGLTVVLWPLAPLKLDTDHAIIVTNDALADDGDCISPAPATRSLLWGEPLNERLGRFAPIYRDAVTQAGLEAADVSVLTVFHTHNDLGAVRNVALDVVERPVAWGEAGGCEERDETLQCEAATTVLDYRSETGVVSDEVEPVEAAIPVTYWLPRDQEGPFPLLVYGHGLNSERDEGYEIARRVANLGFAVIAMEAVEHGAHPSVDGSGIGGDADIPAIRFLGIDLANFAIDSRAIRGNFDQTNIDRLRLIALLRSDPDIDGDGTDDIDPERIGYVGASLGAMCGAGLLALSPDLDAAALIIGGARLIAIVTDTDAIADFRPVIDSLVGGPNIFDRIMPVAQHLIDASDPGTWAAHVLKDRFDDRTPPSVVAPVGMADEVVPPAAGRALARALGIPHLAPVVQRVELIDVIESGPVEGNWADGERTAAFFQFDRVTIDGRVREARHVDSAKCDETAHMIRTFFGAWADGEVPVIDDPFIALGTGPLEP